MDEVEKAYVIATYPNSDEEPMGLTIKGNTREYICAHLNILNSIAKGKTFTVGNDKFKIAQASKKKGVVNCTVILNSENEDTGKADLKVYEPSKNKKKGATIEIRKISDFEFSYVEKLSQMIAFLLDQFLNEEERKKCSKAEGNFVCDVCKLETKSEPALKRHKKRLHSNDEQSKNCIDDLTYEFCSFKTKSRATLVVHKRVNHRNESLPVAKKRLASSYSCSKCNSTFKTEEKMDEHMKFQHELLLSSKKSDTNSPTSSPPRKRVTTDDIQNDVIKEKVDTVDDCETINISLRLAALESKHKEFEDRIDHLMQQRRLDSETIDKLNERIVYLELQMAQKDGEFFEVKPEHIPHLKGFRFFQRAIGNGRCLENCLALQLYQNQDKAVDIKKDVHTHMTDNWDYYTEKVGYPFHEQVGVGKNAEEIVINNSEEMKAFLKSDKSLLAYSNFHTLLAMANFFKISIHIFTHKKEKSYWSVVHPDMDFVMSSNVNAKKNRDLFLYHSFDNHYDLLVHSDDVLKVKVNAFPDGEKIEFANEDRSISEKSDMISKDRDIEELLQEVISCDDDVTMEERNLEETSSKKSEFVCTGCEAIFASQEEVMNHKRDSHTEFKCYICERIFKTKVEMKNHISGFHKDDVEIGCSDCVFEAKEALDLNEHLAIMKHKVSLNRKDKNYERCYTCDLAVDGYWSLMNHRKEYHPSNKKCKNFANGICQFGIKCWYVHEEDMMDTDDTLEKKVNKFECYVCGSSFTTKDEVKKHRKMNHSSLVAVCEKYLKGTCSRSENFCWYKHESNAKIQQKSMEKNIQNFPCSQPQALPPECLVQMMEALEGLGSKVENFKISIKKFIQ